MAQIFKRPNGTEDIIPDYIHKWRTVEKVTADIAETFGFREIRIPTFEVTDLFQRSVGETTDVVQKEMYSVIAKESQFTLRPEGTAGTMRAMLQNGLMNQALPQKVFYQLSCFRHERPQAGRLREFHQFGVEMVGSAEPTADAEVITLGYEVLKTLEIKNITLHLNSIGCPTCRAKYYEILRSYLEPLKDQLCETCLSRLEKNPMRILDCKSEICRELVKDAPVMKDYLCDECSNHFNKVQEYLTASEIPFVIDPKIVRGLDYYSRTVFEFITTDIGAQGTVCAGGRYDGLIEQLGGKPLPALGFGMGLERLILTMESQNCAFMEPKRCDLYIAPMNEQAITKAFSLARELREDGYWVEYDVMGRTFKSQMKFADKLNAAYLLVVGEDEIASGKGKLKNMRTGEEHSINLCDCFKEQFSNYSISEFFSDFDEDFWKGV